jgi:hypothetical protein
MGQPRAAGRWGEARAGRQRFVHTRCPEWESRRGRSSPANQKEVEMTPKLIFLPLIIVIVTVKVKIIRRIVRKPNIRKKR